MAQKHLGINFPSISKGAHRSSKIWSFWLHLWRKQTKGAGEVLHKSCVLFIIVQTHSQTLPSQPNFNHHRRHLELLGADIQLQRQFYDMNNNAEIIRPLIMQWSGLFHQGLKWEEAKSSHLQTLTADGWHSSLYTYLKTRHRARQATLSTAQVINGTPK